MTEVTALVFYEDSRGPGGRFPLHDLVLACVADVVGGSGWQLTKRVGHRPTKGSSKVLAACIAHGSKLREPHIAVVLDGDRLDRALGLPGGYCKRDAREAFASRVIDRRFELFVLDDNLETLLERLESSEPTHPSLKNALEKDLDARDLVFASAAKNPRARTAVRGVKSFDRLVLRIASWLGR